MIPPKMTQEQANYELEYAEGGDVSDWYYDTYIVWGWDPLCLWYKPLPEGDFLICSKTEKKLKS